MYLMATNKFTSYSYLPGIPSEFDSLPLSEPYGAFAGINNNVLIVAGGIRYQTDSIYTGEKFFDDIFILKETTGKDYAWEKKKQQLPFASAYGGAISTTEGLYCFGGITVNRIISTGCFIRYITETGEVEVTAAPDLPVPTCLDSTIFGSREPPGRDRDPGERGSHEDVCPVGGCGRVRTASRSCGADPRDAGGRGARQRSPRRRPPRAPGDHPR